MYALCLNGMLTTGPEPEVQKDVWTREIPSYLSRISNASNASWYSSRSSFADEEAVPPALPRQLEKPFLNQSHVQKDDQSVLAIPAHVSTISYKTNCRLC